MKRVTNMPNTKKAVNPLKKQKTARVHGSRGLHDILIDVYSGINGFNTYSIGATQDKSTYGEVTPPGIRILYEKFKYYRPLDKVSRPCFYDLGSGVGKVVVGMAVLNNEIHSYGIENMGERARLASSAYAKIKSSQIQQRVHFIHDSIINKAVSFKDASWIFISNLCFDAETLSQLAERLHSEIVSGTIIICSRQLLISPTHFETLESACVIPMSWSNSSSCWIYKKL